MDERLASDNERLAEKPASSNGQRQVQKLRAPQATRKTAPARTGAAIPSSTTRNGDVLARFGAGFGFSLAAIALVVGWQTRSVNGLTAEDGLGYALGIVAVCCIALLLLYPLRKRLKFLKFLGPARNWFRAHMTFGVLVPIAALYHCNFQLGSIISQLALFSALLVAGSGLIGRFLYRKIHRNLTGEKMDLKRMRRELAMDRPAGPKSLGFLGLVKQRVDAFDHRVLDGGDNLWRSIRVQLQLRSRTAREAEVLTNFGVAQLARESRRSPIISAHQDRLAAALFNYLEDHMRQVRRIATLQVHERLFALWHVVHLPFFILLLLSVVVHVFAVHLY